MKEVNQFKISEASSNDYAKVVKANEINLKNLAESLGLFIKNVEIFIAPDFKNTKKNKI